MHLPVGILFFILLRDERGQAAFDNIPDSALDILRHILGEQRHFRAGRELNFATVRFYIATQDAHEGRLAGPVATEQPDPLPRFDLAAHRVQQQWPAESNRQILDRHNRHRAAEPTSRRKRPAPPQPHIRSLFRGRAGIMVDIGQLRKVSRAASARSVCRDVHLS